MRGALLSTIPIPDPQRERKRMRIVLKGETPNPANKPSGCSFHTRCPRATDLCREVDPPARLIETDHKIACHHPLEYLRPCCQLTVDKGNRLVYV